MKLSLIHPEPSSMSPSPFAASERLPLCQLPAGGRGRVCELQGEGQFRQRVRELGFGESTVVTKVSGRSTIICQVNGTRIALSHGAASQIVVERLDPTP
ncbi:MAG TPA: FeoA family protein [Candidatus Synoicihabitans sp.]|nr:FeoA family protein [Candidatus Synoicihabitans sp.]